jgi:hypothetical protein
MVVVGNEPTTDRVSNAVVFYCLVRATQIKSSDTGRVRCGNGIVVKCTAGHVPRKTTKMRMTIPSKIVI